MQKLFRLWDQKSSDKVHVPIGVETLEEAAFWNNNGFGIFRTVNSFDTFERKEATCTGILNFAVDIDIAKTSYRNKDDALEFILDQVLLPSEIVETKNGLHVYYKAKNASFDDYKNILSERLIPKLQGDRVKDVPRLLRAPNFFHWKDLNDPFLVKTIFETSAVYTPELMRYGFPLEEDDDENLFEVKQEMKKAFSGDGEFFDNLWQADQKELLMRLSGNQIVNGERYGFVKNNKKFHIQVNGKLVTGCWIDDKGKIGSHSKGGPTVFQWLTWFNVSGRDAYRVLRELCPDLCDKSEAVMTYSEVLE